MQAKLLRALQPLPGEGPCSRAFRRVGDSKDQQSDVRVVAATNRDLVRRIEEHEFREDLYYRLAVITLKLPPLRQRSTDVPLLAKSILSRINEQFRQQEPGYKDKTMAKDAIAFARQHDWPGNVRQLYNTLVQAAVMTDRISIRKSDLAAAVSESPKSQGDNPLDAPLSEGFSIDRQLEEIQRQFIIKALTQAGGVKSRARKLLGVASDQTFAAQLKRLKIDWKA